MKRVKNYNFNGKPCTKDVYLARTSRMSIKPRKGVALKPIFDKQHEAPKSQLNDYQKRFLENVYSRNTNPDIEYILVEVFSYQIDEFKRFLEKNLDVASEKYCGVHVREGADTHYRSGYTKEDISYAPNLPKKWKCISFEEFMSSAITSKNNITRHTYEKTYKREDGVVFEKDSIIEPGFDKLTIEQLIKLEQDLVKKARKIRGLLNSHRNLKF